MFISVIVCTYNRAASLSKLLDCFLVQEWAPAFDYEIIIADNNSKDNTKDTVKSYELKFKGKLHYFFEPKQGKPHALNLSIEQARGEILTFTDDDCIVPKDYLKNVYKAFEKNKEGVDFVGGKICPNWDGIEKPFWLNEILNQPSQMDGGQPNWIKSFFEGPLGTLDYGDKPFIIDEKTQKSHLFYGANMAVKKQIFAKYGKYSLEKTYSQDTEVCQRFLKAGAKAMYAPDIKVFHKGQWSKITPAFYYRWYFLRGLYWENKTQYQMKFYHPLGIQLSMIKETAGFFIKSLSQRTVSQKVYNRCHGLINCGQMIKIAKKNII